MEAQYSRIKVVKGDLNEAVRGLLSELLEKGVLDAVLVPRKVGSGNNHVQSLVTDPEGLKDAVPLSPVMPVNSSKIVSELTILGPSPKKVGVFLKPCETRALVELVKLNQAGLDNIMLIGTDCFGTFSVRDYNEMLAGGKYPCVTYVKEVLAGKESKGLRSACTVCEHPVSDLVDLNICLLVPEPNKEILVKAGTDKGVEALKQAGFAASEDPDPGREAKLKALVEARTSARDGMTQEFRKRLQETGYKGLQEFFSTCIKCGNCVSVCPICYCRECFFESRTFDQPAKRYLKAAEKKGGLRMPPDTLLFHITRFAHMVTSCVACGMCEQACPSGIPLLSIYKTVGQSAQEEFGYVPGADPEQPIPMITFKEEELEPR